MSFIDWFIDECKQQELKLVLVYREHLDIGVYNGKLALHQNNLECKPPDFAVIRTIDPLLSQHLELMNVPVFNSSAVSMMCNHKANTHQALAQLQIPMVDTVFLKKDLLPSKPPLSLPVVMKAATGRGGNQVTMIHTQTAWEQFSKHTYADDVVVQACNVQLGKDVRVFVVGKTIVGAVLRESTTDFRANFTLGGTAKWYELNQVELTLVQSVVDYFDFGMVGIDFLFDYDGNLLFNEIEDVVGSRTLSEVSNVNIIKLYVAWIKERI